MKKRTKKLLGKALSVLMLFAILLPFAQPFSTFAEGAADPVALSEYDEAKAPVGLKLKEKAYDAAADELTLEVSALAESTDSDTYIYNNVSLYVVLDEAGIKSNKITTSGVTLTSGTEYKATVTLVGVSDALYPSVLEDLTLRAKVGTRMLESEPAEAAAPAPTPTPTPAASPTPTAPVPAEPAPAPSPTEELEIAPAKPLNAPPPPTGVAKPGVVASDFGDISMIRYFNTSP
ncbi:MAG: hypothetical protein LBQ91_03075, partial [Oscillospiraceae bacterium]|nr:hypothetical protein [Oscillospiraceae bacterium]